MSFDLQTVAAALEGCDRVARVLVAAVSGSAPREAGAAMLVWADGQSGTIGGGALEWRAAAVAREVLKQGDARVNRLALGPELGQCCGGAVTLVTEVWDAARLAEVPTQGPVLRRVHGPADPPFALRRIARQARGEGIPGGPVLREGWLLEMVARPRRIVWVWGAGHVGRALVQVMAPLPDLAITWVDTAPARFPDSVPSNVTHLPAAAPATLTTRAPRDAEHLILTFSHALDLDLCHALLSRGFARVGLIGSATKWARFRRRLAELGHDPEQIDRIACPIGNPALGKSPQAIAISVAADMLTPITGAGAKERQA